MLEHIMYTEEVGRGHVTCRQTYWEVSVAETCSR